MSSLSTLLCASLVKAGDRVAVILSEPLNGGSSEGNVTRTHGAERMVSDLKILFLRRKNTGFTLLNPSDIIGYGMK